MNEDSLRTKCCFQHVKVKKKVERNGPLAEVEINNKEKKVSNRPKKYRKRDKGGNSYIITGQLKFFEKVTILQYIM